MSGWRRKEEREGGTNEGVGVSEAGGEGIDNTMFDQEYTKVWLVMFVSDQEGKGKGKGKGKGRKGKERKGKEKPFDSIQIETVLHPYSLSLGSELEINDNTFGTLSCSSSFTSYTTKKKKYKKKKKKKKEKERKKERKKEEKKKKREKGEEEPQVGYRWGQNGPCWPSFLFPFSCFNKKKKNERQKKNCEAANLDVFFFLDFGHFLVLLET